MKKNIAKILSFALALTLMTPAFPMVAEAHIHDYTVTKGGTEYGWVDNNDHGLMDVTIYLCSCGDMYKEKHILSKSAHSPAPGSEVYEGSYLDGNTNYDTYRYTCKICGHTYRKSIASIHYLAVEEESE